MTDDEFSAWLAVPRRLKTPRRTPEWRAESVAADSDDWTKTVDLTDYLGFDLGSEPYKWGNK